MTTNTINNALDIAPEKNETSTLASLTKPVVAFAIAIHQARAMTELVDKGVDIESAYKCVYKKAA